jgi:hypothetical protein
LRTRHLSKAQAHRLVGLIFNDATPASRV